MRCVQRDQPGLARTQNSRFDLDRSQNPVAYYNGFYERDIDAFCETIKGS
jgi:hypothetical protein